MEDQSKFALVTGASSGIGKATAIELASRGFKVFACARRVDRMADLIKYNIETIGLDVTDIDNVLQVKEIITEKTGGKLHVLFNNAGQSCTMPALDVTDDMVKQCFEVNVFAPIRLTREFSPLLIKVKGCVAFTGSLAGLVPFPFSSVYGASKAALHQYASMLHLELQPFDVKVLNIVTGGVATDIADKRPLPESSIYYCDDMKFAFKHRQEMAKRHKPMSAEVYANKIVNDMLGSSDPINVYRGTKASLMSLAMAWIPVPIVEFFLKRAFKLNAVFAYIRSQQSKEHND